MAFAVEILTDSQLFAAADQYSQNIPDIQDRILSETDIETLEYLSSKLTRLLAKQDAVNAEKVVRGI